MLSIAKISSQLLLSKGKEKTLRFNGDVEEKQQQEQQQDSSEEMHQSLAVIHVQEKLRDLCPG